jgi:hypothetical protein
MGVRGSAPRGHRRAPWHRPGGGEPRWIPPSPSCPWTRTGCPDGLLLALGHDGLIELKDRFDIAFGNDPDVDRHGIVTPGSGLMNPNHYLAVAVDYLFRTPGGVELPAVGIGKTLVSSSMIDRVAGELGRRVVEVPVGFKWFVEGLLDGTIAFGGEESAGASFLGPTAPLDHGQGRDPPRAPRRRDHGPDRARSGRATTRIWRPGTGAPSTPGPRPRRPRRRRRRSRRSRRRWFRPERWPGSPITRRLTRAPGNDAPIGGLKVVSEEGWFAARPRGPRKSTRSTRRASGVTITWPRSWKRPGRWWPRRSGRRACRPCRGDLEGGAALR